MLENQQYLPTLQIQLSDNILISNYPFFSLILAPFYLESYVSCNIYAPADYVAVYSEHLGF